MRQNRPDMFSNQKIEELESQLVLQCAPVLTNRKISNLLIIKNGCLCQLGELLSRSIISYYVLYVQAEKSIVLLYNREKLESYISDVEIHCFFMDCGYQEFELTAMFRKLRERYQNYKKYRGIQGKQKEYPHEIGVLLGYPLEDVKGFIENHGKNSLYTGYWKVYHHVSQKKALFVQYEEAKATLMELVKRGAGMTEIIGLVTSGQYAQKQEKN